MPWKASLLLLGHARRHRVQACTCMRVSEACNALVATPCATTIWACTAQHSPMTCHQAPHDMAQQVNDNGHETAGTEVALDRHYNRNLPDLTLRPCDRGVWPPEDRPVPRSATRHSGTGDAGAHGSTAPFGLSAGPHAHISTQPPPYKV